MLSFLNSLAESQASGQDDVSECGESNDQFDSALVAKR